MTGQIIVVGCLLCDQLEDGITSQGVVIVLIFVSGDDSENALANDRQSEIACVQEILSCIASSVFGLVRLADSDELISIVVVMIVVAECSQAADRSDLQIARRSSFVLRAERLVRLATKSNTTAQRVRKIVDLIFLVSMVSMLAWVLLGKSVGN